MDRRFTDLNEGFACIHCHATVLPSTKSCRNHCPHCLYSVHLDKFPGDRSADCGGVMEPVRVEYNPKKGYQVIHRCRRCGVEARNVLRLDDDVQPDSLETALEIMQRLR